MSHGQGRRKPHNNYPNRGRGAEAPSGSSYPFSSAGGHRDEYYSQDYSYRPEGQAYHSVTPTYPVQDYAHSAPWSYEQEPMDYDSRPWRGEERRRSPVYEDYHGYREDSSSYSGPRNDEWHDYGRQQYSHPYPYSQPDSHYSQYSNYSSQTPSDYDRYSSSYRDYPPNNNGYSDYRPMPDVAYHDTRRDYAGYSDYRRPPAPAMDYQHPAAYPTYYPRSASPPSTHARGFASHARAPIKPVLFQSAPIIRPPSPPPPPPKRTEPTAEYLAVSLQPSPHIPDPSAVRKLIVLDLNGSLVLRSAHAKRVPPRRGAPTDPYADPTQLRPLRTVHRRPYLSSFTAYILHEQTKKWLDTMVWSSAQPHSVADMVEHCFGNRISELKAVWARDTLGLTADDYHKKSLTLKDLEKPWKELSLTQPTDSKPDTSTTTSTAIAAKASSSHSALTTLLVDDSPAKAALQPWNHLCIRDYVQGMRNLDMLVAERETRTLSNALHAPEPTSKAEQVVGAEPAPLHTVSQPPQPSAATPAQLPTSTGANEADDGVQKVTREVVMVNGELVGGREEVVHRVIREVVMIDGQLVNPDDPVPASSDPLLHPPQTPTDPNAFVPNPKRKAKRMAKKEHARLAREEKEREAFMSLREQLHAVAAPAGAAVQPPKAEEAVAAEVGAGVIQAVDNNAEPEMRYDETLLAVIGVLDHVKHEGNVAGWMRSGGLLQTPRLKQLEAGTQPESSRKHAAPSRSQSPAQDESPTKKTKLSNDGSKEDPPLPSSSLPTPPPTSQMTEFSAEQQAATGVPLSSPMPGFSKQRSGSGATTTATTMTAAGLWYEDPVVLRFWADRGRDALKELGIAVESGMVPVPGGGQSTKNLI